MRSLPAQFPCPTCGELKSIGISKKEKPYYFCDFCGVQVFIRGKVGIAHLQNIHSSEILDHFSGEGSLANKFEIINLKANMDFLSRQIEIFESKAGKSRKERSVVFRLKEKLEALEQTYFDKLGKL